MRKIINTIALSAIIYFHLMFLILIFAKMNNEHIGSWMYWLVYALAFAYSISRKGGI